MIASVERGPRGADRWKMMLTWEYASLKGDPHYDFGVTWG